MEKLFIFLGMALVTYFTRYTMLAALGGEILVLLVPSIVEGSEAEGPSLLQRWLRYVPVAVLAALIAPAVLVFQDRLNIGPRTWAVLTGAVVAWRTGNVLFTILGGLIAFWVFRVLGA